MLGGTQPSEKEMAQRGMPGSVGTTGEELGAGGRGERMGLLIRKEQSPEIVLGMG